MSELYISIILGHLMGDYLFQTDAMALNKTKNTWLGWYYCFVHCAIYTMYIWLSCMCFADKNLSWFVLFLIFNSHFWIDKFSIGNFWMKWVKVGKGLKAIIEDKNRDEVNLMFNVFVYCVVDNTLHLVLMFAIVKKMLEVNG